MWTHSGVLWITESYCQSTVGTARDRLGMAPHHSWGGGGASESASDGEEGERDLILQSHGGGLPLVVMGGPLFPMVSKAGAS